MYIAGLLCVSHHASDATCSGLLRCVVYVLCGVSGADLLKLRLGRDVKAGAAYGFLMDAIDAV